MTGEWFIVGLISEAPSGKQTQIAGYRIRLILHPTYRRLAFRLHPRRTQRRALHTVLVKVLIQFDHPGPTVFTP